MKKEVCEFVTTFSGERILRNTNLGPFSLYKRVRLKEQKLKVFGTDLELENDLSYSILNLVNYPLKVSDGTVYSNL